MMEANLIEKRNVTPKQAIDLLQKKGVEISEEEVAKILDLMYFLAKLVVDQNFKI